MEIFMSRAPVATAAAFAIIVALMGSGLSVSPAKAAPPVATPSPGYEARLAESRNSDLSARRRYYYHHRRYYGARTYPYDGYRPYYDRPYYYRPYYSYGPVVPFLGFGFGW